MLDRELVELELVGLVEDFVVVPIGNILNVYTLVMLSLICDLLVGITAPYLKVSVALVVPGDVALYILPERFGLNIGDSPPGFSVTV